jgi:4-carboxymuconolactone decarboxylase
VKGALRNGVTVDELKELLMHSAIYCGVPAAVDGYRQATAVLQEEGLL